MRIIVPFTNVSAETRAALNGLEVDYIDVSGSDTAYFELLDQLWRDRNDVAIVEQDIVPTAKTLASFGSCRNAYCSAGYAYLGSQTYHGLGCTRFRSSIMRELPNLMNRVAKHKYDGHCLRHWCVLDAAIQRELAASRRYACTAHGTVRHLSDRVSHGCVPEYA